MAVALEEARAAVGHGDVPIGAVVARLDDGRSWPGATTSGSCSPTRPRTPRCSHSRDAAAALGRWRLDDCALVVTLEPCPMCAGAAINGRVGRIVFGAADPKAGAAGTLYNLAADPRLNHEIPVLAGVQADASAALLRGFFAERR